MILFAEKSQWFESHVSHNTFLENKYDSGSLPSLFKDLQGKPLFRITHNLLTSQKNLCISKYKVTKILGHKFITIGLISEI